MPDLDAYEELEVALPKIKIFRVVPDGALKELLDERGIGTFDLPFPCDVVQVGLSRASGGFLRVGKEQSGLLWAVTTGGRGRLASFSSSG